jgi:F-type H+-transporting ATPase subunit b
MVARLDEAARIASRRPGENQVTKPIMRPSTPARGAMGSPSPGKARTIAPRSGAAAGLVLCCFVVVALAVSLAAPAHASDQLVLVPNPPILVALIVAFVILIAPVNSLIFRPLFRVLDERDAKIAGATKEAGLLVERATNLTEEYRGAIREARDEAEGARKQQLEAARSEQASITGEARRESEDEIARARDEIASALAEARETLEVTSRDLAKVAAERILGRPLQ